MNFHQCFEGYAPRELFPVAAPEANRDDWQTDGWSPAQQLPGEWLPEGRGHGLGLFTVRQD